MNTLRADHVPEGVRGGRGIRALREVCDLSHVPLNILDRSRRASFGAQANALRALESDLQIANKDNLNIGQRQLKDTVISNERHT